ncbi:MAG TPA: hypothetical protein VFE47_04505 [Tepidisphaeraceae bacterium]|jgi:DNA-binding beta-propeller fold protein YncE|nr:hypothetical protein [Tepidisphaeraceae bacterium]
MHLPKLLAAFLLIGLLTLPLRAGDEKTHSFMYFTSPDGAQGGGSGTGILIFDMNDGHKFVRRINIPDFKEGVRGVCASAVTHRLYASTSLKRIVCLDLETDKILWNKTYDTGVDRLTISPDGKTLYAPCGYWSRDHKSWAVIDANDGRQLSEIPTPSPGHNTVMSLDGKRVFLASNSWLSVVDTKDNTVLKNIETDSHNFFPLTVNSDRSKVYCCLGREVGFQIIDPDAGKILETVYPDGDHIKMRTHGVGLTPDEKEIWIAEQNGTDIFVFDNTVNPPKQSAKMQIGQKGHGWISFSRDGKFGYTSSVEVFDAHTKKVVAIFKDENGKPVCSSKTVEVIFHGPNVVEVGDQFGVGRLHPPAQSPGN